MYGELTIRGTRHGSNRFAPPSWRHCGWVLLFLVLAMPAAAVEGQDGLPPLGNDLSLPVQEMLVRLQDQWLQWDSAFRQADEERAEVAVNDMLATATELGMVRLPDFALGVLVRAVESVRKGDDQGASEWAVAMAERLDPGRAETAFARSRIAALEGSYLKALGFHLQGYLRVMGQERQRNLWLLDLLLWALSALILTSGFYIVLQMMNKGSDLYNDMVGLLDRFIPTPVAHILPLLVLGWPFLLPEGWMWIVLYWLVLLWGYGTPGERWVMAFACLVFAATPIVHQQQHRMTTVALSEQMRVVENLSQERLYGGMFQDLELLQETLPDSQAVDQLVADVHSNLGQADKARPRYLRVIAAEPENYAVLINLGVLHYHRKEYFKAIDRFVQASEADATAAAASYNLSKTYRSLLAFDQADSFLAEARASDSDLVREWINQSRHVITVNGGFQRRREIRDELSELWQQQDRESASLLERTLPSAVPPLIAFVAAFVLHRLRRNHGYSRSYRDRRHRRGHGWREVFVPGLASTQAGEGGAAFLALLVPIGALMLSLRDLLGYRIPWGYDPGRILTWTLVGLVLSVYVLARVGGYLIGQRR